MNTTNITPSSQDIDWSSSGIYKTIKMIYRGDGSIQTGDCFTRLANESEKWYKERKRRAQQNYYLQTIIQNRYMPIFTRPISRERDCSKELESLYEVLDRSMDNAGTNRNLFMRQGAEGGALFQRQWLVIDDYSIEDYAGLSLQDQKKKRVMPYFKWVDATQVDFDKIETDVFGNITQFAFNFSMYDEKQHTNISMQKIYTKEGIAITSCTYLVNGRLFNYGAEEFRIKDHDTFTPYPVDFYNIYGEIPVYTLKYTDGMISNEYQITPQTISIAKFSFCLYCRQSETEMTMSKSNMSLLVYPNDSGNAPIDTSNDNYISAPVTGNMPTFLAPDLAAVETSYMMTEKDVENIFRQEALNYATGTVSQSGLSKEMDNIQTNTKLSFYAYELKICDEWIDTWFARWMGKDKELTSIDANYKLEYSTVDIEKQIKVIGALFDIGALEITEVKQEVINLMLEYSLPSKKSILDNLKEIVLKWIPTPTPKELE